MLFLFVVMMLDVDFTELRQGFLQYLPVGSLIGIAVAVELILVVGTWAVSPAALATPSAPIAPDITNTAALGQVLYTKYFYFFQLSGLVLLTAMIGAIVLTLRHKPDVKRQSVPGQNARTPQTAIEVKKVPSRAGV